MAQSSVLAAMLTVHRAAGTYANKVTRYIALNDFCRRKFIEGGLPADRIVIKPNFVDMPYTKPLVQRRGGLFVGRLSHEKGTQILAAAATNLDRIIVDVIGIGDEREALASCQNLNLLGWQNGAEILERMRRASYLVMPSIWYENFPRTLVEAFACGLPVIASRIGALAEIIKDEVTGLLFEPGNPNDLADKVRWAEAHPDKLARMGQAARTEYEEKYTAERNYETLMRIYGEACQDLRG
jgi:glycosyltransferase involved in cell wall biosynthesis